MCTFIRIYFVLYNVIKCILYTDVDEDMQQEPFELKDDLDSDMSWDDSLTEK